MRIGLLGVSLCFLGEAILAQGSWGVTALGPACGGTGSGAVLGFDAPPRVGTTSQLRAASLPANSFGHLILGMAADRWSGLALPLNLSGLGMPGCTLQVRPDVTTMFTAPSGVAQWGFGMPNTPSLEGYTFFVQAMFSQPGLNAGGQGITNGLRAKVGPPTAPVNHVTSISQWGITWRFEQPTPAGRFANGDWFVLAPARIVDITPRSVTSNGRVINGSMINPDPSVPDHGYDSTLYGPGNGHLYRQSLNVAWGVSATNPLVLQPGQSLISTISFTGTGQVPQLRTAAVLTCLADAPVVDAFRPAYAGTQKEVRFDASMLDWQKLRRLPPVSGTPSIATVAGRFQRPWLDHSPNWPSRMLHPIENMPDYGRDLAAEVGQAALLLHLDLPQADKRDLLIRLVQLGIDNWGNVRNGCRWPGEGGHGSGRKFPILFAGAMLGDAELLNVGQSHRSYRNPNGTYVAVFGEDCQTFFVATTSPGVINWGYGGYRTSDIGLPEYGFSHVQQPANDNRDWLGDAYRRCCTANAWVGYVLVSRLMGLDQAWNHPALFAYQDRFMATEPTGWTRSWLQFSERMWDTYRSWF